MISGRHLGLLLDRARASLWLVPSVMVLGAIVLSTVLLYVDEELRYEEPATQWWLFAGNAEGARTLLSVVASSLITVVSVAFSVTMIAIQQASTQYTPRVLRNYMRDRGNQLVLGTYLATFTYALLVLRGVRAAGEDEAGFVPTFAILAAMLLALASLGALIYFMHHVADSLQVSTLLRVIRKEFDAEVERMFPETFGAGAEDPATLAEHVAREEGYGGTRHDVTSGKEGYLSQVDEALLAEACAELDLVVVPVQVGERLQHDTVLAMTWRTVDERFDERVRRAFRVDNQRSVKQDPLFGIRQMVDIAVKALSPGINDPTTAEEALAELVGAVATVARREMPSPARRLDTHTRFLFQRPTFASIVDAAFSQIRSASRTHFHVTMAVLAGLQAIAARLPTNGRREPLEREVKQILETLPLAGFTRYEEDEVRRAAREALDARATSRPRPPSLEPAALH